MSWFGVRSVYRFEKRLEGRDVYEERVVLFQADDAEAAIARAEHEADKYATDLDGQALGLFQSFWLFDEPGDATEVFSLNRTSDLAPDPYLDRFFDSGEERQNHL